MCNCDWATGECQAPLNCKALGDIGRLHEYRAEIERLRTALMHIEAMADKHGPMAALGDVYEAADVARKVLGHD